MQARHGGWWRYERRHEDDLEIAYRDGRESVDMLLAGNIYVIDFENMCQYRKDAGRYSHALNTCIRNHSKD